MLLFIFHVGINSALFCLASFKLSLKFVNNKARLLELILKIRDLFTLCQIIGLAGVSDGSSMIELPLL